MPADEDTDNVYHVTVVATDGDILNREVAKHEVTVTVTDVGPGINGLAEVDEAGGYGGKLRSSRPTPPTAPGSCGVAEGADTAPARRRGSTSCSALG